jgi:hypothetical protein
MHRFALSACAVLVLGLCTLHGQAPAAARGRATRSAPVTLSVRRVVLYKSGVGYFEHIGRVRGNAPVAIDLTSTELDDVLNSMTVLDLGGGAIAGISYDSVAPLPQRAGALGMPPGPGLSQFLEGLRGARIEVRTGGTIFLGRLLGVERKMPASPTGAVVDEISLISENGDIRTVDLTPASRVRLVERQSVDQVGTYLGILASARGPDRRRMTIATTGAGDRDFVVGYVTEAPIWKTSYRIVLSGSDEPPLVQGWAIVDNTTAEDWTDVNLSLIAGAPQSFVQAISQPSYARRPVVQVAQAALLTPQAHEATLNTAAGRVRGVARDQSGNLLPGVTVRVLDEQHRTVAQGATDGSGAYAIGGLQPGPYRLEFVLAGFSIAASEIVVTADRDVVQNSQLRPAGVQEAVAVSSSSARSAGIGPGHAGGVTGGTVSGLAPALPPPVAQIAEQTVAAAAGQDLSDLFEYRLDRPVTIARNHSALVPIVNARAGVERVSIWNARGGARPLRGLWFTNTTGLTLDSGSFTVIDAGVFAGEGILAPLKPGEQRLLSYGVDASVIVEPRDGEAAHVVGRLVIDRGVLVEHRELRAERAYTIRNNDTAPKAVVLEHPVRPGWTLAGTERPAETSAAFYRFKQVVPAGRTIVLTVKESQPLTSRFAVASLTDEQLHGLISDTRNNAAVRDALLPIVERRASIAALTGEAAGRDQEIQRETLNQQRIRENLVALGRAKDEARLTKRYAAELAASEDRLAALRREAETVRRNLEGATSELARIIETLALDVEVTG